MFHAAVTEINTDLDHYMGLTADDIRRVATKYLDPANALVIIVKPPAASTATEKGAQ
jgi:predicted Zn-dependent peptidase